MKKSEMIYTHRVEQCNQTVSKSGDKKEKLKLRQKVCNIYSYQCCYSIIHYILLIYFQNTEYAGIHKRYIIWLFFLTGIIAMRMRNYYDEIIDHLKED